MPEDQEKKSALETEENTLRTLIERLNIVLTQLQLGGGPSSEVLAVEKQLAALRVEHEKKLQEINRLVRDASRPPEGNAVLDLIYFLLIGLVAGWVAGKLMKGRGFGVLGNLVVGLIGAVLGGFLFRVVGLLAVGLLGNLISATVGAIVLLLVVQKINA